MTHFALGAIDPLVVVAATGPIVAIALAIYTASAARKAALEARTAAVDATLGVQRVGRAVNALHQEVRPPSNGTTTGAYAEFWGMLGPWIVENLMDIHAVLGTHPRRPPPELLTVDPPPRPK